MSHSYHIRIEMIINHEGPCKTLLYLDKVNRRRRKRKLPFLSVSVFNGRMQAAASDDFTTPTKTAFKLQKRLLILS